MVTTDDYTFAEADQDDQWAIRLRTLWPGVTYVYGKIKVIERIRILEPFLLIVKFNQYPIPAIAIILKSVSAIL